MIQQTGENFLQIRERERGAPRRREFRQAPPPPAWGSILYRIVYQFLLYVLNPLTQPVEDVWKNLTQQKHNDCTETSMRPCTFQEEIEARVRGPHPRNFCYYIRTATIPSAIICFSVPLPQDILTMNYVTWPLMISSHTRLWITVCHCKIFLTL